MRFPIVWITFALCVVLCGFVESGPVSRKDLLDQKDQEPSVRLARQIPYDDDDDEDSEEDDDDDEEQQLNYPAAANQSEEDEDEGRAFRRSVRDVSQKPVVEVEADEDSVVPSADTPVVPEKKPSVLELLSSALDKAIEATSKIPTQQVASDAAGVFQILGQVFSEAIDKVIGEDDGPEDNTEVAPESTADNKVPEQQQPAVEAAPLKEEETSQSDKEIVNNL